MDDLEVITQCETSRYVDVARLHDGYPNRIWWYAGARQQCDQLLRSVKYYVGFPYSKEFRSTHNIIAFPACPKYREWKGP